MPKNDRSSGMKRDSAIWLCKRESSKHPLNFLLSQYHRFVWTLVDVDEKNGVPEKLVSNHTRHFVIYSSSPAQSPWAHVHKTVREYVMVMNPWTRKEILRA